MSNFDSSLRECFGFSHIIISDSPSVFIALELISPRFPIGVEIMYKPFFIKTFLIFFILLGSCAPANNITNNKNDDLKNVAPVQISWLATCNTVGFENIDYLIADENVINSDEEKFYPEKILKMPNIWNAHCGYDFDRKFNNSPCQDKDIFTLCVKNLAKPTALQHPIVPIISLIGSKV